VTYHPIEHLSTESKNVVDRLRNLGHDVTVDICYWNAQNKLIEWKANVIIENPIDFAYHTNIQVITMNYTQTKDLCVSAFHKLLQRERLTAFLFKVRNWSPIQTYYILYNHPPLLFIFYVTYIAQAKDLCVLRSVI